MITLIAINLGGVAKLSDGTFWRIAGDHFKLRAAHWPTGTPIGIDDSPVGSMFGTKLTNLNTGESVNATSTQVRF